MASAITNRIAILQSELESLRQEQREDSRILADSRKWKNALKNRPSQYIRAIVWAEDSMSLAWFMDGKWYSYDGTWFVKEKDEIKNVTHWMGTDWMSSDYIPPCGPGVLNRARYWLSTLLGKAHDAAGIVLPKAYRRNAQLDKGVVFYRDRSGTLVTGMPEHMPVPRGFEKIVCTSALEAERYSEIQRRQDRSKHQRIQEERERIEGPMKSERRAELHHLMSNARNSINREFLRAALERDARTPNRMRYERESYLHAEGFEKGR